jgi:hypothetical protein
MDDAITGRFPLIPPHELREPARDTGGRANVTNAARDRGDRRQSAHQT